MGDWYFIQSRAIDSGNKIVLTVQNGAGPTLPTPGTRVISSPPVTDPGPMDSQLWQVTGKTWEQTITSKLDSNLKLAVDPANSNMVVVAYERADYRYPWIWAAPPIGSYDHALILIGQQDLALDIYGGGYNYHYIDVWPEGNNQDNQHWQLVSAAFS